MIPRSLNAQETGELLGFRDLIDALGRAVGEVAEGRILCPARQVVALPSGGRLLAMNAVASDLAVHKLVTVVPANAARGLPTLQGRVTVLDAMTGSASLTLDAASVTGRRTAALTLLGIRALLPVEPRAILVIGTGVQAANHVDAFANIHPEASVYLVGREDHSSRRFVADRARIASTVVPLRRIADAPAVDVVVTCTSSRRPVYRAAAEAGRLIVAVGSYESDVAEIDASTVRGCELFVDDPVGARHEAGDLIMAGVDWRRVGTLADALVRGPRPASAPLLLKTVGCAAWDLAAARVATDMLG